MCFYSILLNKKIKQYCKIDQFKHAITPYFNNFTYLTFCLIFIFESDFFYFPAGIFLHSFLTIILVGSKNSLVCNLQKLLFL